MEDDSPLNPQKIMTLIVGTFFVLKNILLFIAAMSIGYGVMIYTVQVINIEISTIILEYLKVLSWPLVVVVAVMLLKDKLQLLFKDRSWSVSAGSVSLQMGPQAAPPVELPPAVAEDLKKNSTDDEPVTEAIPTTIPAVASTESVDVELLQKALFFERIYNNIYGSQIITLTNLRSNAEGMWHVGLVAWFEKFKKEDTYFQSANFDDYINYLIKTGLAQSIETPGGRKYAITDRGTDFLSYLEKSKYSFIKPH